MGFLGWLYSKGIAGAIAKDLITKYRAIKEQHPSEADRDILIRVWNFWLTLNENAIRREDGEHKIARLEIIKERRTGTSESDDLSSDSDSLLRLYEDILYIETEITASDGKIYDKALQVFLNRCKEEGLDFTREYEAKKRVMRTFGI